MRHDHYLEGEHFALRPVDDGDVEAIISLRSDPERTRFLPPVSGRPEDQRAWLKAYYQRPGDYYFAVVRAREAGRALCGFISVYDVESRLGRAQWGRVILKRGSGAFPEATLLSYQFAFEVLGLKDIYIRTIADNIRPLNFHDQCGLRRQAVLAGAFEINGRRCDAVEHVLSAADWPAVKIRLAEKARGR
jgi:RimJ/RimL family protein N-acetyltransferase